jgi:hypothetical protein
VALLPKLCNFLYSLRQSRRLSGRVNFEITFANRAPRRHPCQIVGRRGPAIVVGTFLQVAGSIPASRATSRAGRTVALRDFSMADQMSDYTSKPNVDPKAARRMSSREIADELRRALRQDIGTTDNWSQDYTSILIRDVVDCFERVEKIGTPGVRRDLREAPAHGHCTVKCCLLSSWKRQLRQISHHFRRRR